MPNRPWYQEGLRFECTECGDCCTGDTGYVWVNKAEIAALAAEIGEADVHAFERDYVRKVGVRKSLKEFPNGDCALFDPNKRRCAVYGARPRQCRTWPFWDSNLKTAQDWRRTCEVCPGSGSGQLFPVQEIETLRKVIRV